MLKWNKEDLEKIKTLLEIAASNCTIDVEKYISDIDAQISYLRREQITHRRKNVAKKSKAT